MHLWQIATYSKMRIQTHKRHLKTHKHTENIQFKLLHCLMMTKIWSLKWPWFRWCKRNRVIFIIFIEQWEQNNNNNNIDPAAIERSLVLIYAFMHTQRVDLLVLLSSHRWMFGSLFSYCKHSCKFLCLLSVIGSSELWFGCFFFAPYRCAQ